jgi:arsenite-transporting ATPase
LRIIIYTGKGGVGKTSIAAATAIKLAAQGYKTLVMSTDAAHSLSDSFNIALGSEPTMIGERLWGQEIDSLKESEKHWGVIQEWVSGMLDWAKLDDISTEDMFIFPGMEELFNLMQIKEHATSGEYDVLIVDCAPTGETLRLLSYPDLMKWWLEKIFPLEKCTISTNPEAAFAYSRDSGKCRPSSVISSPLILSSIIVPGFRASLTAFITDKGNLILFSSEPPYSSFLVLLAGDKNCPNRLL